MKEWLAWFALAIWCMSAWDSQPQSTKQHSLVSCVWMSKTKKLNVAIPMTWNLPILQIKHFDNMIAEILFFRNDATGSMIGGGAQQTTGCQSRTKESTLLRHPSFQFEKRGWMRMSLSKLAIHIKRNKRQKTWQTPTCRPLERLAERNLVAKAHSTSAQKPWVLLVAADIFDTAKYQDQQK